jgi:hypothetical protein
MPKSLCPYFWQLLIMYVFIIPYVLFALPYHLLTKWENESFASGIFGSIVVYLGLFGVFIMGSFVTFLLIGLPEKGFWSNVFASGFVLWFVTIAISIYHLIKFLWSKIKDKSETTTFTEKKPSIIVEFVKAKYNRYCPKITWK